MWKTKVIIVEFRKNERKISGGIITVYSGLSLILKDLKFCLSRNEGNQLHLKKTVYKKEMEVR